MRLGILPVVIFTAFSMLVAHASSVVAGGGDDLDLIRERGVARVAVSHAPPDIVKDLSSGEWSGPFPELYRAIFAAIDVEVEFVDTPWGAVVPALQSGGVDVALLSIFPARAGVVDNSDTIIFSPLTMVLADSESETVTWESLDRPDFRVAVIEGTIYTTIAANMMQNATFVPAEDTNAMLLLVETGRADAAIGHVTVMQRYAETRGGALRIPEPEVGLVNAFAFRKGNPDFKRFLDNSILFMKMNGSMRAIFARAGMEDFIVD